MPIPEGFALRPPGPEDVAPIVALLNEETLATMGVRFASAGWVTNMWSSEAAELEQDFAVVHADNGDLAGYLLVSGDPPYTEVFAIGVVGLAYLGRGLGTAVLAETERRAQRLVGLAPPERRVVIHAGGLAGEPRSASLLSRHGYVEVRRLSEMRVEFDGPPEPVEPLPGIEIRALAEGDEAAVYACMREAFIDHWGEGFPSEHDWMHSHVKGDGDFDPELWALAWRGSQLAGALIGVPHADEDETLGHVDLLGVRRAFRRRGVGEALLRRSFVDFHARGRRGVCLYVDADSVTGATRLYERVGMVARPRFAAWEKELRPGLPAGRGTDPSPAARTS
jgi:mycothiol synthase